MPSDRGASPEQAIQMAVEAKEIVHDGVSGSPGVAQAFLEVVSDTQTRIAQAITTAMLVMLPK